MPCILCTRSIGRSQGQKSASLLRQIFSFRQPHYLRSAWGIYCYSKSDAKPQEPHPTTGKKKNKVERLRERHATSGFLRVRERNSEEEPTIFQVAWQAPQFNHISHCILEAAGETEAQLQSMSLAKPKGPAGPKDWLSPIQLPHFWLQLVLITKGSTYPGPVPVQKSVRSIGQIRY